MSTFFRNLYERIFRRGYIAHLEAAQFKYSEMIVELRHQINDQRFLLNEAPMQNTPEDILRASCAVTSFAYAHPSTAVRMGLVPSGSSMKNPDTPWVLPVVLIPSRTRWVFTSLMPEGRVIFTPNRMPGLEARP